MGQVNISLPSDGTTADVSDYNTPLTTIVDEINGNLDNSNISASAAIAGSKLASESIGNSQIILGMPVQKVSSAFSAVSTGTVLIPQDDTVPQNTEGNEIMTQAVTPKSSTNILVIEVTACLAYSVISNVTVALFQDSTAGALAAIGQVNGAANGMYNYTLTHTMIAGTTSATTFKVRAGGEAAGTITFNGKSGGRLYGAITKSSIVITEYKAS